MLPELFVKRLNQILPEKFIQQVMHTFSQRSFASFRINLLKADHAAVIADLATQFSLEPVSWYREAFVIPASQKKALTETIAYQQGKIYLQDLASMLAPLVLDPQPHEEILDLTAAPGSKTSQIAALMQNTGRLAAVEKSRKRFFKLKQNLATLGVTCADLYNKDGRLIWKHCQERFDRVLLDAPCSSEARFNTEDPESYRFWNEKKIKEMARNQWTLLNSAMLCLKPGGILVYSTCSFSPEENENNLAKLIKKYKNQIEIEPITLNLTNRQPGLREWQGKPYPDAVSNAMRIIPTEKMSGFFICRIKKLA